jgi:hypothetical protein
VGVGGHDDRDRHNPQGGALAEGKRYIRQYNSLRVRNGYFLFVYSAFIALRSVRGFSTTLREHLVSDMLNTLDMERSWAKCLGSVKTTGPTR